MRCGASGATSATGATGANENSEARDATLAPTAKKDTVRPGGPADTHSALPCALDGKQEVQAPRGDDKGTLARKPGLVINVARIATLQAGSGAASTPALTMAAASTASWVASGRLRRSASSR